MLIPQNLVIPRAVHLVTQYTTPSGYYMSRKRSADNEWYEKKLIRLFRRGEQTAAALENNLANLESKIDQLLASFEGDLAGEAVPTEKEAAADADGKGETGRSGDVEEKKPT